MGRTQFQSTRPIRGATIADSGPPRRYSAFQSTRPIRGATRRWRGSSSTKKDFNPRAPYGARLPRTDSVCAGGMISIHAPHTGRDTKAGSITSYPTNFNPRAPYGARLKSVLLPEPFFPFQSTRPIRGATPPAHPSGDDQNISIHAPHTGRDGKRKPQTISTLIFQSTRPIRGATTPKL